MYEKGVGVGADKQKALNLYRRAAGLSGDYVIVESSRYQELEEAAQKLALREQEIDDLQRQLDDLRKQQKKDAIKRAKREARDKMRAELAAERAKAQLEEVHG